jgi:heme A synthase
VKYVDWFMVACVTICVLCVVAALGYLAFFTGAPIIVTVFLIAFALLIVGMNITIIDTVRGWYKS